MLCKEEKNN